MSANTPPPRSGADLALDVIQSFVDFTEREHQGDVRKALKQVSTTVQKAAVSELASFVDAWSKR